ncbi:MAG: hypothetical protein KatS3mg082_2872 [Nitrospiraceae bacterium]|nr:MAG: hypothetical protein KatS3mg082_2872 [Nitrospiraceae bacterium]
MSPAIARNTIVLPRPDGSLERYVAGGKTLDYSPPTRVLMSRVFLAATHVVCDPLAEPDGSGRARLDWESTLAFRHHVWAWGLGVADAMDTAQRGMGLDWGTTAELIRRSGAEARSVGGRLACGAGTDHLPRGSATIGSIISAYCDQCALIEDVGAQVVLLASRALAASARGPDDYRHVYDSVLGQVRGPVILHWLGEVFDPALAGYWGYRDPEEAIAFIVDLVAEHVQKIDGIKVSLLNPSYETALRRALPSQVRVYTGDDLNYPELIAGDGERVSDALLGIFDPITPAASAALQALDLGDVVAFKRILEPTVPLARHVFANPTFHYKTDIVFLAYLNGHQDHFRMVAGMESARSIAHLSEVFRLADGGGVLVDPELATARMRRFLALAGVVA